MSFISNSQALRNGFSVSHIVRLAMVEEELIVTSLELACPGGIYWLREI